MIARWLIINLSIIIFIILWSFIQGYASNIILFGKILAQVAFALFLVNLNMYFFFLFIRKSKVRKIKTQLAKMSKHMMKYHIPIAITATCLIMLHSTIMLLAQDLILKAASGILAVFLLSILLFTGFFRRRKATGLRRKLHYRMAFLFFTVVLVHIFI